MPSASPATIRVLLVDDHPIVRDGLSKLLSLEEDIEIAGRASDGGEALDLIAELHPDVVLLDIRMPKMDGIQALESLRQTDKTTRVVILTASEDRSEFARARRLGCSAILLKQHALEDIAATIRLASATTVSISPREVPDPVSPSENCVSPATVHTEWVHKRNRFLHDELGQFVGFCRATIDLLQIQEWEYDPVLLRALAERWPPVCARTETFVASFEQAMSPAALFSCAPLSNCDAVTKGWLADHLHRRWIASHPVHLWIEAATRLLRECTDCCAQVSEQLDAERPDALVLRFAVDQLGERAHTLRQFVEDLPSRVQVL